MDVVVHDGDETDARLWEIAENLHRAELTDPERREHIAEWVRLVADKLPHDAAVSGKDGRGNEGAISKASKDLGLSKDTVARALAAESLPDDVKAAADEAGLWHRRPRPSGQEQPAAVNDHAPTLRNRA